MRGLIVALLSVTPLSLALAVPAQAEVVAKTDAGFVSRHVAEVTASPEEAWKVLVEPAEWWNGEHSFSGDAKNLSLDARAGGCFCEVLPGEGEKGWLNPRGGVEHMRVVFVDKDKALRMTGGLGPLQSEALSGALTITLKPVEGGTRLTWEYVVGGYMRYKPEQIVPAVDKVLGEQLSRLADKLGRKVSSEAPKPQPGMEAGR
ncbi:SRPBCC family protein [Novosphingobium sp. JCM 18896]|uniref:SRPBCC family protein n=1 Tax=Novosphingobium sp. JCM 18896 TaxID=2989731 RepID=UPI0022233B1F|nr:SRPBCC domain-containing protein [Novosphingobium sp. JCM 18896]MCW1429999.1 SRPBCC domain-containing protein [Novosphingobium sp. JCM 18896]